MDNRATGGWGESPDNKVLEWLSCDLDEAIDFDGYELNIPYFMTKEYQAAEAAAKAAKAHALQRNADHRQDRARVDGMTLLWGLSLIALGLAVMM